MLDRIAPCLFACALTFGTGLAADGRLTAAAPRLVPGSWGGAHVLLQVNPRGATVEFDCAHGTIAGPIRLDRGGRFSASGTHAREHGGPVREGEAADARPARYTGRVEGRTMTLTVTLVATGEGIGTFSLTRDREPILTKCL
jgi:hypothetical protein